MSWGSQAFAHRATYLWFCCGVCEADRQFARYMKPYREAMTDALADAFKQDCEGASMPCEPAGLISVPCTDALEDIIGDGGDE